MNHSPKLLPTWKSKAATTYTPPISTEYGTKRIPICGYRDSDTDKIITAAKNETAYFCRSVSFFT
jgi:hypothetical protein